MKKRDRNIAIGTLVAAGIGYAAGVLTAPKSGKETRKDIQKAALKAKKEAEIKLKSLHIELSDLLGKAIARAENLKSKSGAELNQAIKKAQIAKEKASKILSAMHEGEADDQDLDKAVKDVKAAIENLKTFVAK